MRGEQILLIVAVVASVCLKEEFAPLNEIGSFSLMALPYQYKDLEPVLWMQGVYFHHKKEHSKYVDALNQVVHDNKPYGKYKVTDLLIKFGLEDNLVASNAGGYYNHALMWWSLKPSDCNEGKPEGKLLEDINQYFGDFDSFKIEFGKRASALFGSGWVWLCADSEGHLSIVGRNYEYSPLAGKEMVPILGIDVWEHAYYLYYLWDREEWVKRWWEIVDWDLVGFWYKEFVLKGMPIPV